ncbi:hypothetical protein [Streptomyces sp. NPDC059262]|uniref:hypothetical protein n=1 Tax=Streptomyces sp. NPDC059262 TaxID=3346797 RepID=UPI0036CAD343
MVPYLMGGEALYAAASPPGAHDGQGGWIASWVIPLLPNTMEELQIWVVIVAVAVAAMGGLGSRRLAAQGKKQRPGFDGAADVLLEGLGVVIGGTWRFAQFTDHRRVRFGSQLVFHVAYVAATLLGRFFWRCPVG